LSHEGFVRGGGSLLREGTAAWGERVEPDSQAQYAQQRRRLAERLREAGVRDRRVLDAMAQVPRHLLLPEAMRFQAYRDGPLPIGDGQTISAPGIVAAMTEALELTGKETVLEIGTGSGYQAAVLSRLAAHVVSIERLPGLASQARSALDRLGVSNVVVHLGDGSRGRGIDAPYDAIVITAGAPDIPPPLIEQLAPRGRLVGPVGDRAAQTLVRVRRDDDGSVRSESLGACRFVGLVGEHGWAA
jgi:protein-L-isoaspartate(D-aspartate) O-methyltransferase